MGEANKDALLKTRFWNSGQQPRCAKRVTKSDFLTLVSGFFRLY